MTQTAADAALAVAPPLRPFDAHHLAAFIAQETLLEIVPRFAMPRVEAFGLSSRDRSDSGGGDGDGGAGRRHGYGPFAANYRVKVPMWLALYLRQADACAITLPEFLSVAHLEAVLDAERASATAFQELHFHFFEIARQLLDHAARDLPQATEIARLVEAIRGLRRAKILDSLRLFEGSGQSLSVPGIRLSNLVSVELHFLRSSFCVVLDTAADLERRARPVRVAPGAHTPAAMRPPGTAPPTVATTEDSSAAGAASSARRRSLRGDDAATTTTGTAASTPQQPNFLDDDAAAADPAAAQLQPPQAAPAPKRRRTLRQQ